MYPNDCIEWPGAKTSKGYGHLMTPTGKDELAHRLSYDYFLGPIPPGHDVHHTCENKICINPYHLEAIDHALHKSKHIDSDGFVRTFGRQAPLKNPTKYSQTGTRA